MTRVSARGPNRTSFGPFRIHVPRPRLQSNRTLRSPLFVKATVYLVLSSGVMMLPSPPWNLTTCHEVSPRPARWTFGPIQPARTPSSTIDNRERFIRMTSPANLSGERSVAPLAFVGSRAMDADALVGAPAADLGHPRLLERFDAHVDRLAAAGRVGTPDDLPLAPLIRQPISELEIHRQRTDLYGSLFFGR